MEREALAQNYLREAEYRARRFSGAYTGTAGTLAADVLRLLFEVELLRQERDRLYADNAYLRAKLDMTY